LDDFTVRDTAFAQAKWQGFLGLEDEDK